MENGEPPIDPKALVARIIGELQAVPEAGELLLRALLTEEFLSMPLLLARMEERIVLLDAKSDRLDERITRLAVDLVQIKTDGLETKLPRLIRPLLSQRFGLRRAQTMQGAPQEPPDLVDAVESALRDGRIDDRQEACIDAAAFVVLARSGSDGEAKWVAVEASIVIGQRDIERARAAADALGAVFGKPALAVTVGYGIQDPDQRRADAADVHVLLVGEDD